MDLVCHIAISSHSRTKIVTFPAKVAQSTQIHLQKVEDRRATVADQGSTKVTTYSGTNSQIMLTSINLCIKGTLERKMNSKIQTTL